MNQDRVIVVGSGPTGVIAAWTLIKAGIPVLMLESGGKPPQNLHLRVRQKEFRRPVTPAINDYCDYAEFVNLNDCMSRWIKADCRGGRSNFWSGIVLRYSEQDFRDGERLDHRYKWPIKYQDLEPYYTEVEQLIRVRGGTTSYETLPACHVVRERSITPEWKDFEGMTAEHGRSLAVLPDVYGPDTIISSIPTPQNIALRLMAQLRKSKLFRLIQNAHVARIQLNRQTSLAKAVEYLDTSSGEIHQSSANAVILAAGPLASTKILLNSNCSSFPDGLGNTHGLLGRYLHDHPMSYTRIESDFVFDKLDDRDVGGLYITRDDYSRSKPLETFALCLYGGPRQRRSVNLHQGLTNSSNPSLEPQPSSADQNWMMFVCFGTQIPRYENHIALHPTQKDKYGLPLLQVSTKFSQEELENMARGRTLIPEILSATHHKSFEASSQLHPPGTSVHYGGTSRMHDSPQYGVIDQWNRVHDIHNLLVVDAGCFTTCVEKNPTLTAMAIAMRAADRLAQTR